MRCIYCLEDKKKSDFQKREHVIPQSFGLFSPDNLLLYETICDDCNQYFGDKIELFLGRDSFEGVERLRHGLKPKAPLARRRRVKSKIKEGDWKGLVVEERPCGVNELGVEKSVQVGFYNANEDEYHYFTPDNIPSKEELIERGYLKKGTTIWLVAEEGREIDELISLLRGKGIEIADKDYLEKKQLPDGRIPIEMEVTIDRVIMRGFCKIAFNYLAYVAGKHFMFSENFHEIRRFIRYDQGDCRRYLNVNQSPILYYDQTMKIKTTNGHLITVEWNHSKLFSKVSLFNTYTYGVTLCDNFSGIWIPLKSGHHFDIETKQVSKLMSVSKRIII